MPHRQLAMPPMEVQTLSPSRESDGPRPGNVDDRDGQHRLTDLLVASVDEERVQDKFAARAQGYDPAYWSRIKAGEKKAQLDPVADLPEDVQRRFLVKWGRQLQMTFQAEDARRRRLLTLQRALMDVWEDVG